MSRALNEATIKFTSDHQSLVDAYAQHQLSANEITSWLNDLKVSVALCICRAYTKKKLSSLKILSMQISKTMRKVMIQITSRTMRMKKKTQKKDLTKKT